MSVAIEAPQPTLTDDVSEPTPATNPKRTPKKKTLVGKLSRSALMLIRRVHLYSGIFMFPWVLLYGFTGWFFNHPGYFTGDEVRTFSLAAAEDEAAAPLPTAAETAEAIVAELNLESFLVGGPEIALSSTRRPQFTGHLSFSVNTPNSTHAVTVNPVTGAGEVRTTYVTADVADEPVAEKLNPLASLRGAPIPNNVLDQVRDQIPDALQGLGLSQGEAFAGRRAPSLEFAVVADGVPCLVSYNLGNGGITSHRQDDLPSLETKSFLQRLHLARTYAPQVNTRWVWAVLVDAMFVSMVFWGISGLFMWWQVKRTRWLGGGVLVASVVFAVLLGMRMHEELARSGRGNRGGGGRAATNIPADPTNLNSFAYQQP